MEATDDLLRLAEGRIAKAPDDSAAWAYRGLARTAHGQFMRALADYDEALRLDPENADAFMARADIHFELGNDERADEDYARAVELDPDLDRDEQDEDEG